ncbi:MAG: hypothetical protein ACJ74R_13710 [Gaiellaceae bacterium]
MSGRALTEDTPTTNFAAARSDDAVPAATVCTAGDHDYFPGVVALINSLHVVDFGDEIVVLDLGFTEDQRARLGRVARLVPVPSDSGTPRLATSANAKSHVAELKLSGVVIWIDSDIIVTAPLDDVVAAASAGKICVIQDDGAAETFRIYEAWPEAYGLRHQLRVGTYVNGGFFALSTDHWPELLTRFSEACARIPRNAVGVGSPSTNPFWGSDQDALNAVLMSEVEPSALHYLNPSEMVPTRMLPKASVRDAKRLDVAFDERRTRFLHAAWAPKPWMPGAWTLLGRNAYVELLPRLLFAPDIALPLDSSEVPPWLWATFAGSIVRAAVRMQRGARRLVGLGTRTLPEPVRARALAVGARFDDWARSR